MNRELSNLSLISKVKKKKKKERKNWRCVIEVGKNRLFLWSFCECLCNTQEDRGRKRKNHHVKVVLQLCFLGCMLPVKNGIGIFEGQVQKIAFTYEKILLFYNVKGKFERIHSSSFCF